MKSIYEYIQDIIVPGLVFVEIGANAGDTAQKINDMILGVTKEYTYTVFEPDSRFWLALLRLEKKYPCLRFYNKAVSNTTGKTELHVSSGQAPAETSVGYQNFDCSSSIKKPMSKIFECWPEMKFSTTQIVDTLRLDDCRMAHVDFIWCDIQGAEIEFIEGALQTLRNTRYLLTEYNEQEIYENCPDLEQILKALPNWKIVEDYKGDVLLENKLQDI